MTHAHATRGWGWCPARARARAIRAGTRAGSLGVRWSDLALPCSVLLDLGFCPRRSFFQGPGATPGAQTLLSSLRPGIAWAGC